MTNRVCEILGIGKPVISAAMVWITNAEFVAAVSEAGGAGVLGFNAGYDTVTSDPVETVILQNLYPSHLHNNKA